MPGRAERLFVVSPEPLLNNDVRGNPPLAARALWPGPAEEYPGLGFHPEYPFASLFLDLLRQRVGGLITLSNLAADVQVSPRTAASWLEVLERMQLYNAERLRPPKATQIVARLKRPYD